MSDKPIYIYVGSSKKTKAKRTEELGKGVYVDYDSKGKIIGIELLNPKILEFEIDAGKAKLIPDEN